MIELEKMVSDQDVIIGIKTVKVMVNLSRATIYREMNKDNFPKQVKQSNGRVGWLLSEIRAHIKKLADQRGSANDEQEEAA